MSLMGQSRPNSVVRNMSGLPPLATELRTSLVVRFVPILLQKSFLGCEQIFPGALVRSLENNVRGHMNSLIFNQPPL